MRTRKIELSFTTDKFETGDKRVRLAIGYAATWGIESERITKVTIHENRGELHCTYYEADGKLIFFMCGIPGEERYSFHS